MAYRVSGNAPNYHKRITEDRVRSIAKREVGKEEERIRRECIPVVFELTYNCVVAAMAQTLADECAWTEYRIQQLIDGMQTWLRPLIDGDVGFDEFAAKAKKFCKDRDVQVVERDVLVER
jgi:hypothetical protein